MKGIEKGGVIARDDIQAQFPKEVLGIRRHSIKVEEDSGDIILDHPSVVLSHCGIKEIQLALVIGRVPETAVFRSVCSA